MPSSQLKRAGRAIQTIRDQAELPNGGRATGDCRRHQDHRGPFVDTGRQRTPAPFRGDGTAKSEMTIDHIVLQLAASIWT
jgi:hypothetical protein